MHAKRNARRRVYFSKRGPSPRGVGDPGMEKKKPAGAEKKRGD